MAETATPYGATTEAIHKTPACSLAIITPPHFGFKLAQLILSFVAFICEEIIYQCENCSGLYFFEFVSCSAFLLTIIMIVVYISKFREKINMESFKKIDFYITVVTGVLFLVASIVFIATIDKTSLANTSAAFGFLASFAFLGEVLFMWKHNYLQRNEKQRGIPAANGVPEGQPLNTPVQENNTA